MDSYSENKLASVNPELASRVHVMASSFAARGVQLRVVSGLRSTAQQAVLYANRASNPLPVAVPGTSKHEQGLAVDLAFTGRSSWSEIGAMGESLGLKWGGRFSKKDPPHFELPTQSSLTINTPRDAENVASNITDNTLMKPSSTNNDWLLWLALAVLVLRS
jgi:hypothetical protein